MTQTILVPIDGSDNADTALDVAAEIAAKVEVPLKILHIGLREPGPLEDRYDAAERAFEEALESSSWTSDHSEWPRHLQLLEYMGDQLLAEAKARAASHGAPKVETMIDWGEAGERILHHAKHPPCGMIVMGSRGASPMEGALMGSVSHKVFHLAPCTCVTVHARTDRSGLEPVDRILVPYDGSDHAAKALDLACKMATAFGAGLKLLYVLERGASPEGLQDLVDIEHLDAETRSAIEDAGTATGATVGEMMALPPMIPPRALQKVGEAILAGAERAIADKGVRQVESVILDGNPASLILETANRDQTDLIVMGMRGLGELAGLLLGSVSYKVNHLAPCTCITVR